MNTAERLKALQKFTYEKACKGKLLKAQSPNSNDIFHVEYREPECFVGLFPQKKQINELDAYRVAPSILIIPGQSNARLNREKRFDRYDNIKRQPGLSADLSVQFMFSTYDPGARLQDEVDVQNTNLIEDNTENAIYTLTTWIGDFISHILGNALIPNTDLMLWPDSIRWSLLDQDNSVDDRRPYYYGFIDATYATYSHQKIDERIEQLL